MKKKLIILNYFKLFYYIIKKNIFLYIKMFRPGGLGVDINGDGIPDVRVGPFGTVRPDIGMNFMGAYPPMYGPPMMGPGVRLDVNGDGIPDVAVGPFGQVRPDIGSFVPPAYPAYYPPPYY